MLKELTQLRLEYSILLVVAAVAAVRFVGTQWVRLREAELRLTLAEELLERQSLAADVERLVVPAAPKEAVAPSKLAYALPALQGAALFVAALFSGISLVVYVAGEVPPRPHRVSRLAPETWVVPVSAGGESSCRIRLDRDAFAQGNLDLAATVIARSPRAGTLYVGIAPEKPSPTTPSPPPPPSSATRPATESTSAAVPSYGPPHFTVRMQASGEPGDFTVLVTAVDRANSRATAVFTVQVRPAPAAAADGQAPEMLGQPTREEAPAKKH